MIDSRQIALIAKDFRSVATNKRLFPALIIVPLMMAVILPSIFVFLIAFIPLDDPDIMLFINMLPGNTMDGNVRVSILAMIINSIIPLFFLLIPIMAASIMAASSFVGEKEKRTLETLLYSPLTLEQIFNAKILASFVLSMVISLISFFAMVIVIEIEAFLTLGSLVIPDISWLLVLVLVSPAITIIAITLIVRGSAKAQTMEESQQRGVFLIIPVILLAASQFTGLVLLNAWILLAIGIILAVLALFLMRRAFSGFSYESLLL